MKILVTGAGGFVGRHVLRQAKLAGHDVLPLIRSSNQLPLALKPVIHDLKNSRLEKLVCGPIDAVCHLAAKVAFGESIKEQRECYVNNIIASLELAAFCLKWSIRRVVVTSSVCVYSTDQGYPSISESASIMLRNPYALSKYAGEQVWLAPELRSAGISVAVLRCTSIYGLGQRENSVLPIFINRVRNGLNPIVYGAGTRTQDFVSVYDVVDAHLSALTASLDPGVHIFNIGSGYSVTMKQLAEHILSVFDDSRSLCVEYGEPDSVASKPLVFDISKAKMVLAYHPISLEKGLADYRTSLENSICQKI